MIFEAESLVLTLLSITSDLPSDISRLRPFLETLVSEDFIGWSIIRLPIPGRRLEVG